MELVLLHRLSLRSLALDRLPYLIWRSGLLKQNILVHRGPVWYGEVCTCILFRDLPASIYPILAFSTGRRVTSNFVMYQPVRS